MSEYYWELITKDGTCIEIPPSGIDVVKKRMGNHDPINTRTQVIPYAQIEHFRITSKPYSAQNLLEEVAQAFNDPIHNEDGSIVCRWVKKEVTQDRWNKYYSPLGYKRIGGEGGITTVAMRLPVHLIDTNETPYCSDEEVHKLTRKY